MRRLKVWIFNTFFKEEILMIRYKYVSQVKQIENESRLKTQNLEVVHRILSEKNKLIVGEADNKNGEHVFIVQWVFGKDIWFMLYSREYRAINRHPRIMASYYSYFNENPYIVIDDVLVEDNNVGNGSILMPYFIKYCRQFTNAKYISGVLSYIDSGHFDRSEYFYKKHGFEVYFNDDRTKGSIKYHID